MNRLIRVELLKLRTTPALPVSVAITVVFGIASVVTGVLLAGRQGAAPLGTADNVVHTLSVASLSSMVMLVLGILLMAGEYRHRTILGTYLGEPRRSRVLIAKLVTATGIGTVVGAAVFTIALAVAVPLYASKGVHHFPIGVGGLFLGSVLATACYGLLGVALGALTRNTVGAVIGALIWVQVVEVALLQSVAPSVAKWLPTGAGVAVTSGGTGSTSALLSPGVAALVLLAWTAAIGVVATRLTSRAELR